MRRFALATLLLASSACGRDLVVLKVNSALPLSVPTDVDTLVVTTSVQGDGTPLRVQNIDLTKDLEHPKDNQFPLEVLLRIDDDVPKALHHEVEAKKAGLVIAVGSVDGSWKEHHTEDLTVTLD